MSVPSVKLRPWRDADLTPYTAMNADPEVMRYFPAPLSAAQTAESFERLKRGIEERGWGLWVVEVDGEFAGFTGLAIPRFEAPFMPATEIGWRLRREFWGRGIAFAAARQALAYGFDQLQLREIVSFTAAVNLPSRRLMERLGFAHDLAGDFEHPSIAVGHPLRAHVLYRLNQTAYRSSPADS